MSQIEFAKAVGVKQATVSLWEKGTHRPTPDGFTRLAGLAPDAEKFFFLEEAGVPKELFLGGLEKLMPAEMVLAAESVVDQIAGQNSVRKVPTTLVPLLSDAAAAGNPLTINEQDVEDVIPVPASWFRKAGKPYAVRVSGDSMEPYLLEGFIAFVDVSKKDPKRLVNRMVAARVRDGVTIKWLRSDGRHLMLVAQHVSTRHQTQVLTEDVDWSIVGEVVKWIGEPPPSK